VAQDYKEAARLYGLAAAQGNANAQYNLGVMYDNGTGVAQDYKEAVRLYRLAAAQGDARAQSNLGTMYEFGTGVAQDYVRAHMWYNLGAISGDKDNKAPANRDSIAAKMTPAQIAEAQAIASKCQASKFKQCQ
jgi:TPR repeat protein